MLSHRIHRTSLLLAASGAVLLGQAVQTSQLSGDVRDAAGAPIADARVVLSSPAMQGTRTYVTDAAGRFTARLLPPGEYVVQITKSGYQALRVTQRLALAQSYSPRFTLQAVGNATVEVVGTLAQLDKNSVETSTNFQMEHMENLPITRTPESMLILTPGVVDASSSVASTATGYEQMRGALTSNNKFLIDGQNVNDSVYGNRSVSVIDDAIQEVQIITGAISAEYGDVDGGVVNTITKTGGNTFTGSLRIEAHNDSWDATQPFEDHASIVNKLIYDERLSVGGYFIKDKLWFFVSGYQASLSTSQALSAGPFTGTPYAFDNKDKRLQTKLSWQLDQDNALSFSYVTHRQQLTNNNFAAGDLAALEPQLAQDSAWSLNWMATLTSHLALEARLGEKKEALTGGGVHPGVTPVYDANLGLFYNNGVFNNYDGGDHRDNQSADVKATLEWEGAGNHETAAGVNYMKGINRAQNQQSPTDAWFLCYGYDPTSDTAATNTTGGYLPYMPTWISSPAKAYNETLGLFANDKWTVDSHWSFNLGLRWDKYHAWSQDSPASAGASGFSPRLGLKYDLFGDATWQASLSFSRYNSSPLSNIVNSVSNAGNPTEIDFLYTGPIDGEGNVSRADLTNSANYTQPIGYSSPFTTRLASGLRVPHTNEYQASLAHSFRIRGRESFVKLTLVRRDYLDLFDYRAGNDGTFTPPPPYDVIGSTYTKVWENNPDAKRLYKDAELEWGFQGQKLNLSGNVTWSDLEGNSQGEASGYGPTGAGLGWFSVVDGKTMYDWHLLNPYGKLVGDVPLRIRVAADYHWDWSWGTTTVGAIYRFDSGQHVSITRSVSAGMINPDLADIAQAANSSWTQYYQDQRGTLVWNSQAYTDLTLQQDFKVVSLLNKGVKFFLKVTATNVFNHQQQISTPNAWDQAQTSLADPFVSSGYPLGRGNFAFPRQYRVEAGFKF